MRIPLAASRSLFLSVIFFKLFTDIKLKIKFDTNTIAFSISSVILSFFLSTLYVLFFSYLFVEGGWGGEGWFFRFLFVSIITPALEEIFYRGYVFGVFRESLSLNASSVLVSMLFVFVHGFWDGFGVYLLFHFIFSFIACNLYENDGLVSPFVLHFSFNSFNFFRGFS